MSPQLGTTRKGTKREILEGTWMMDAVKSQCKAATHAGMNIHASENTTNIA